MKAPDGSQQEATISKLTDASWYTVGEYHCYVEYLKSQTGALFYRNIIALY